MGLEDWKTMICAETGRVSNPISLNPNGIWIGRQELSKL